MDLSQLENLLEIKYATCGRQVLLPEHIWLRLKNGTYDDGTTLLMKAARDGIPECVELLLRCGVDVNESRNISNNVDVNESHYISNNYRAIDLAVERGHSRVLEILLQWDSILPECDSLKQKLKSMIKEDQCLKTFFDERNQFHRLVKSGDDTGVERILSCKDNENHSRPKYWVNDEGLSLLYVAAHNLKYDVWALLKSRNFEYLGTEGEKIRKEIKKNGKCEDFDQAIARYFVDVKDSHIYELLLRTRVLGGTVERQLEIISIYLDANKVPEAKLLMQCLQNYANFELIFDLERHDISCVYSRLSKEFWGVTDFHRNRVYVSGCLETHSDVVSNLIHELCHMVMHSVFDNYGLPYLSSDIECEGSYRDIFSSIMREENLEICDPIIQRVKHYPKKIQPHELIVRIPEIITKYKLEREHNILPWEKNSEDKTLLLYNFYCIHVKPQINRVIEAHQTSSRIPIVGLVHLFMFFSSKKKSYAKVNGIEQPKICFHHGVGFLQVSNLPLGVSHLEKSRKNLVVVDWNVFSRSVTWFETQLSREYFENLAVIWDKGMGSAFCDDTRWCKFGCPAYFFKEHIKFVTLIIPKEFNVLQKDACMDYEWDQLSEETKEWILNRKVSFQGKKILLKSMIGGIIRKEDLESNMRKLIDADGISMLIDNETYEFGNDVLSEMQERGKELMRDHPGCYIPRRIRVRTMEFVENALEERKKDVILVINATEDDLKGKSMVEFRRWEGKNMPMTGSKWFVVNEDVSKNLIHNYCEEICKELSHLSEMSDKLEFAHFFQHKGKVFNHIYSQRINEPRCLLIADGPGCGKSVYVHNEAEQEKKKYSDRWVAVVHLTEREDIIETWNKSGFSQRGYVENFLYQLISKTRTNNEKPFERNIFNLFCQAKDKVRVYIDGFDEICPNYKDKVSSFLMALLKNTCVSIVVTTRTHERVDLEKYLFTLSYCLVPFGKEEQLLFLNQEWNALLTALTKELHKAKIEAISEKYKCHGFPDNDLKCTMETPDKGLAEDGKSSGLPINFTKAAEVLIGDEKILLRKGQHFSENPLQIWMLARESFDNDLFLDKSVSLSSLYKHFVVKKIELYSKEKAKERGLECGDALRNSSADNLWMTLKKFSAFFFLQDPTYLKDIDVPRIIRIGIVAMRSSKPDFIHRTFGEYLFSCWLLEGAADLSVRKILLEQVLVDEQFYDVRRFLDCLLSPVGEKMCEEWSERVRATMSQSTKENTVVDFPRTCFDLSITECHGGIIQFLVKIFRDCLAAVLFEETVIHEMIGNPIRSEFPQCEECLNAFTLCGALILSSGYFSYRKLEILRILRTLISVSEKNGLVDNLSKYISKQGFWWTGVHMREVWENEDLSKEIKEMFDDFLKYKEQLKNPLKELLMRRNNYLFFTYVSSSEFNFLKKLLDEFLSEEDIMLLLTPSILNYSYKNNVNMVSAWTGTVIFGGVTDIKCMWSYLESKLTSEKMRQTFLRRKDFHDRNSLIAALCNGKDREVNQYVWELMKNVFGVLECKTLVFKNFEKIQYLCTFSIDDFLIWLEVAVEKEILQFEEVVERLLLSKNKFGDQYLEIYLKFFPNRLFKMQTLISKSLKRRKKIKICGKQIVDCLENPYFFVAVSCLKPLKDFLMVPDLVIPIEFPMNPMGFIAHLMSVGLIVDVTLDEQQNVCGLNKVSAGGLIKYLVLLWRQLELETAYFSKNKLVTRMRDLWFLIFCNFPEFSLQTDSDPLVRTRSFLIPYFFSMIVLFLSKEEVSELLVCNISENRSQSPLFLSMLEYSSRPRDTLSFLAMYDVARVCMGEDALWKIHSVVFHGIMILDLILEAQEENCFEPPPQSTQNILKGYAIEKYVNFPFHTLQSYSCHCNVSGKIVD